MTEQREHEALPAPRLEFRWEKDGEDWTKRICVYSLTLPLQEHDIRREDENYKKVRSELSIEIGRTSVKGGWGDPPVRGDEVDTPYRDGAHARWDSDALGGLPIYAVCGDIATLIRPKCAALSQPQSQAQGETVAFQARVQPWMLECFGAKIAADQQERNHRFLEEALELVQSCGATASEAHQLVDYVYGRPVGEKQQEVGGVMVTLAALCLAQGLDMHAAGETELARIWTKVGQIRAKQAAKPKHSPLPEHAPSASPAALTDEQIIREFYMHTVMDDEPLFTFDRRSALELARALLACQPSEAQQDEREAPFPVVFRLVAGELPTRGAFSTSYGGTWTSDFCVCLTLDGHAHMDRLSMSAEVRRRIDRGERLPIRWFESESSWYGREYYAWVYVSEIRAALAAQREGGAA